MTPDATTRKHHRKSISKLNYFAACPGFESPPFSGNAAAEEGTALHSIMELAINLAVSGKTTVLEGLLGAYVAHKPQTVAGVAWEITDEHRELLEFCARYADQYLANPKYTHLKQELYVKLLPEADTAGYFDLLFVFGESIGLLVDWKFGRVAVPPAQDNFQGKGYAAGTFKHHPEMVRLGVVFVQPRLFQTSEVIYTRDQLPVMLKEIREVLDSTESPDRVLRVNPYCSYCAKQTTCPAIAAHLGRAVVRFHSLPEPPSFDGAALTKAEDVALLRHWVTLFEPIIESIKKRALDVVIANGGAIECQIGDEIIRYSLHERNSSRVVGSPNLVANALREHLLPEQVLGAAKLSIGKLESIWAEQAVTSGLASSKTDAVEGLNALLTSEGLLSRPDYQIQFLKATREKQINTKTKETKE